MTDPFNVFVQAVSLALIQGTSFIIVQYDPISGGNTYRQISYDEIISAGPPPVRVPPNVED
jgi:hypothetical protein